MADTPFRSRVPSFITWRRGAGGVWIGLRHRFIGRKPTGIMGRSAVSSLVAAIAMSLVGSTAAHAELSLVINTATKNFWFSGTATGTPLFNPVGPLYEAAWYVGSGGVNEGTVAIDSTYLTPTGNTFLEPDSGYLGAFQGVNSRVALFLYFNTASSVTLQGLGPSSAGYYGDWGADQQGRLESYIGGSLPLEVGSGFGALAVVPEPATYAMTLAGAAVGGFSIWRRRKRA